MSENGQQEYKVTWKGWVSLVFLVVSLSGVCAKMDAPWKAFDFMALVGHFGELAKGVFFTGKGGSGARDGFLFALTLIPTVMLALGLVQVAESLGALRAAEKMFRPILRVMMGIPGFRGLAFVSSFTSSDVASVLTRNLYDEKFISDDERTIFVAYQYAGSAVVGNTFATGGPLLAVSVLPVGIIILLIFIVKVFGANMARFYLNRHAKKELAGEGA